MDRRPRVFLPSSFGLKSDKLVTGRILLLSCLADEFLLTFSTAPALSIGLYLPPPRSVLPCIVFAYSAKLCVVIGLGLCVFFHTLCSTLPCLPRLALADCTTAPGTNGYTVDVVSGKVRAISRFLEALLGLRLT